MNLIIAICAIVFGFMLHGTVTKYLFRKIVRYGHPKYWVATIITHLIAVVYTAFLLDIIFMYI